MPPLATPPALVSVLEEDLASSRGSPAEDSRALAELFRLFTSERGRLGKRSYLDDPRLRRAYFRYHLPLNAARAAFVLEEALRVHPSIAELDEVVDLGAGLGSASAATLLRLPPLPARRYTLVDRSRAALSAARSIIERCAARQAIACAPAGAASGGAGLREVRVVPSPLLPLPAFPRRALVWLSFVLNELGVGAPRGLDPASFLRSLSRRLEPGSVLISIEPALRAPGRNLLAVHDAAAGSGDWRVLAPCTHQKACPLLRARDRSWCHFRFDWRPPGIALEIARPLGLGQDPPALSYLVLLRGEAREAPDPASARVIGDPMPVRGGDRAVYICRDGERELLEDPPGEAVRGAVIRADRTRPARSTGPRRSRPRSPGRRAR